MILAIDFDKVIHNPDDRDEGRVMGKPMRGAVTAMQRLDLAGHHLIIHTVRAGSVRGIRAVKDWLNFFGVPHQEVTAVKPNADYYLDDKAIRFTTWADALEVFTGDPSGVTR